MTRVSKREQNKERLRSEILAAAKRIILRNHTADFTMPELANEAGVALATPYKHFHSKAGILLGLMELALAEQGIADRVKLDHSDDGLELLLEVTQSRVAFYTSNPELYRAVISGLFPLDPAAAGLSEGEVILKLWEQSVVVAFENDQIDRSLNTVLVALTVRSAFVNLLNMWAVGSLEDQEFFEHASFRMSLMAYGLATKSEDKEKWRIRFLDYQDRIIRASLVGQ